MMIAYTMAPGRGDTDLLLQGLATDLAARGFRCCGAVQINSASPDTSPPDARPGASPCDMDVQVLPDGPVLRISQNLGASARGCRLDPAALEAVVGLVAARLSSGTDLLIINKFGKHEAEGRGFREVIATAAAMDIPVVVGLNALNREAFEIFAGGLAIEAPTERSALTAFVEEAVRARLEPV